MRKVALAILLFVAIISMSATTTSVFAQQKPATIIIQSEKDWKKYYNENFQAVQSYELYVPGRDLVLTLETSPQFVVGDMASGKGPSIDLPLYENGKLVFKTYRNYRATQQLNRWIVRTISGKDLPDGLNVREILTIVDAKVARAEFNNADTVVKLFNDHGVKKGIFVDQIGLPYVENETPTPGFEQTMSQSLYIYRDGDTKMAHFATFLAKFAPDRGELSYQKLFSYSAPTMASSK